jgi:hypothetical protein
VKIRIEGTPKECQQATPQLAELFEVVSISDPYPNRGHSRLVRVYVEVRLADLRQADHDGAADGRPQATHPPDGKRAARTLTSPQERVGAGF